MPHGMKTTSRKYCSANDLACNRPGVQVPCARLGVSRSTVYQMSTPINKALGEGNCGSGDRLWEGSLRMRSLSRHSLFRRRPHLHQTCEATDRNVIQGRFGQASGPSITKPFPVDRPGKWRACAGKVHVLIRGGLESRSGSRLYAESRSRVVRASRRFQQSAEAIVRIRHMPLAAGRAEP